ncbi:MAG: transglycosylase domain-containing protein [Acetanaerobacterium sp.]
MAYVSKKNDPHKGHKTTGSTAKRSVGSPGWQVTKGVFAVIGRVISTVMLVFVITGCIVATVLSVYILRLVNTEDVIDLRNFKQNYTSIIYAEDPETGETYELQRLVGNENRIWVGIEDIPEHTREAFIAIEDKRFEEHSGVDWLRTGSVTLKYLTGQGQQGGSTITQQLIKNITGEDEVTIPRKVQEIFRAINVEKVYSKDDILEAYLNTIALANNTNGVQAAANLYFGKDVSELTITESAAIASITQFPEKYNPFTAKGSVNNKKRREDVLFEMFDQERITQKEYDDALAESARLNFNKEEAMQKIGSTQSYFVDHLMEEVIADLVDQKGMTRLEAETKLLNGGYRIYSTIDPRVQAILDEKFADDETFKAISNAEPPQAAMVITDPHGRILGIAGGRGEKVSDRVFNYATMATRQPGSSIKPLSVYALSIDYGILNYSSIIEDSPLSETKNGKTVLTSWPTNHYAGYWGNMTLVRAIQNSTNTIAVKVCQMLSPRRCFDFMKNKLGITTLVEAQKMDDGSIKTDLDLSPLALGSLTDGVSVLEMTGAYQIFANGGTYTRPYAYTRVLDAATGEVVLENKQVYNRVISDETAYIMNRLLYQVVNGATEGTGRAAKVQGAEVVGKTGTSDNNFNQWFMGATPHYVAGLWIGYDRNKRIHYPGAYPPVYAWKQVMQEIVKLDEDPGSFPVSDGVVQRSYCTESGELATALCPETAVGYYKSSDLPGTCTVHLTGSSAFGEDEYDEYDEDGYRYDQP